jgi:hypothetical protein
MICWLYCCGPVTKQSIMAEGHGEAKLFPLWWLEEERKREGETRDKIYPSRVTYFLQWGLITELLAPTDNAIKLWIHQWINPLIRSNPPWSNHFPKVSSVNIVSGSKLSIHELLETLHYPYHNTEVVQFKSSTNYPWITHLRVNFSSFLLLKDLVVCLFFTILESGAQWQRTCLAHERSWVPSPILHKQTNK